MNILVACEESQAVTVELRRLGHEAYSCDIIECSGGHPEWHIQGDALMVIEPKFYQDDFLQYHELNYFQTQDGQRHCIEGKWDMIIAFPPCTYLTVTGNRWFNVDRYGERAIQRQKDREEAIKFFMEIANADCERIAIENPVGIMSTTYRKPDQIINPWQFGDPFEKKTCLWLKGVEKLKPLCEKKSEKFKSYAWDNLYDKNGKVLAWNNLEIKKIRSKTFPGIAKAMAEQWAGNGGGE